MVKIIASAILLTTIVSLHSSTSNETIGTNTDPVDRVHQAFPSLTDEDMAEFVKVYDKAQFSSEKEWLYTFSHEPGLRCGVRASACHSFVHRELTFYAAIP